MTGTPCELCDELIGLDDRRAPFQDGWVHEYCARNHCGAGDGLLLWDEPDGIERARRALDRIKVLREQMEAFEKKGEIDAGG